MTLINGRTKRRQRTTRKNYLKRVTAPKGADYKTLPRWAHSPHGAPEYAA